MANSNTHKNKHDKVAGYVYNLAKHYTLYSVIITLPENTLNAHLSLR